MHEPSAGLVTPVNIIEVKSYTVRPTIPGFGTADPDIPLGFKAEISGTITYGRRLTRPGASFM